MVEFWRDFERGFGVVVYVLLTLLLTGCRRDI